MRASQNMAARTLLHSTNVRSSIHVARTIRQGDECKLCTTPNADMTRTDANGIGTGIASPSSRTLKTPVDVLLCGLSRDLRGEPEQIVEQRVQRESDGWTGGQWP